MKLRNTFLLLSILASSSAFAFDCPTGTQEAFGDADVTELVRTRKANLVFSEAFVLHKGQSRIRLGRATVMDQSPRVQTNRKVKPNVLRDIVTYDYGHNSNDLSYFLYTDRLRVHFEGSKFHRTYKDLLEHSDDQVRICMSSDDEEI